MMRARVRIIFFNLFHSAHYETISSTYLTSSPHRCLYWNFFIVSSLKVIFNFAHCFFSYRSKVLGCITNFSEITRYLIVLSWINSIPAEEETALLADESNDSNGNVDDLPSKETMNGGGKRSSRGEINFWWNNNRTKIMKSIMSTTKNEFELRDDEEVS